MNDAETHKTMKTNIEHFEAKIQITAKRKKLKLQKELEEIYNILKLRNNHCTKNVAEIDKTIITNLELFLPKIEMTPERKRLSLEKK